MPGSANTDSPWTVSCTQPLSGTNSAFPRLVTIEPGSADALDPHHADVSDPAGTQMSFEAEAALLGAAVQQFTAVVTQQGAHRRLPVIEVAGTQNGVKRNMAAARLWQGIRGVGQAKQRHGPQDMACKLGGSPGARP